MAKKVTVSIPDLLHEKMEEWRESFNLSKMFQEAVTEAIQKKEELQRRIREDLDLTQIVERLRTEKMQCEGNYHDSGKADGVVWAKTAHYEDLVYALGWYDFDSALKDRVLGDYFQERQQKKRLMQVTSAGINEYFRAYIEGWKSGVEQFWSEICDKL
jgi:Arc/MetJ-type ribon-helix-helix transcriptional regulator